jgi:hypothetical protein
MNQRTLAHAAATNIANTSTTRRLVVLLLIITLSHAIFAIQPREQKGGRASATAQSQQPAGVQDIPALILEVARNERAMLQRRLEYTWTMKLTDRDVNKRGEVTKESVNVYEVYPVRGEFVRKLVSKDGVPLAPEQAEKEFKRAVEALEKAEREQQKREASATPSPTPSASDAQNPAGIPSFGFTSGFSHRSGFSSGEISLAVWRFFRYAEFQNPRRERLNQRDAIVLDFRPRADFRPANEVQKPYARLAGRVWIDAADKAVVRLEAWPISPQTAASDAKTSSAQQEPAVVFEHTRVAERVWLESLVRIKTNASKDVFNGLELDYTKEARDFQRFSANTGDEKLDAPKEKP